MTTEDYLKLFHELDDSEHCDCSDDFDYKEESRKVDDLKKLIRQELGLEILTPNPTEFQDCSHFTGFSILHDEGYKPANQGEYHLRVSTFGSMITFIGENSVPEQLKQDVLRLIDESELRYIPSSVLGLPYTGKFDWIENWHIRFFDYT